MHNAFPGIGWPKFVIPLVCFVKRPMSSRATNHRHVGPEESRRGCTVDVN